MALRTVAAITRPGLNSLKVIFGGARDVIGRIATAIANLFQMGTSNKI